MSIHKLVMLKSFLKFQKMSAMSVSQWQLMDESLFGCAPNDVVITQFGHYVKLASKLCTIPVSLVSFSNFNMHIYVSDTGN